MTPNHCREFSKGGHEQLLPQLILVWKVANEDFGIQFDELFAYHIYLGTRGRTHGLNVRKFISDTRKKFFSQRIVDFWNSLRSSTV